MLITAFAVRPEDVVEKERKKYVAYVNSFLKTYVYYYDYKNYLVQSAQFFKESMIASIVSSGFKSRSSIIISAYFSYKGLRSL